MKKIVLFIVIVFWSFEIYSQASIKIYTELAEETAQFMVWLNDEPQDAYPSDEVIIESLLPGQYTLKVSFNSDTIADWSKSFKLKANENVVYKVVKMTSVGKEVNSVGRDIGNLTGKTGENDSFDLVQYYKLEKQK